MRITGGQAKGRRLESPKGIAIRPTSDRVREAIFNIIGQDLTGFNVLDLFAGTGSLGIEALSRGAFHALFVDNSQKSINLIKKNLALCGYQDSGSVSRMNLRYGIPRNHHLPKDAFDLTFLDPPYRENIIPILLKGLIKTHALSYGSRVVAESLKGKSLPVSLGKLEILDTRSYGDTTITIYAYLD
jgi:16S rRNA (guanine966-N2)-methyltransferase